MKKSTLTDLISLGAVTLVLVLGMVAVLGRKSRDVFVVANSRMTSTNGGGEALPPNPNAYYSANYLGGSGARDRVDKIVKSGVLVNASQVKLGAFPRRYGQSLPLPQGAALSLSASLERPKIIEQGDLTYLQVGLQALKGERRRRQPLNLAMVLDVSGSMLEQDKLAHAREAAHRLVDQLTPQDVLALIAFDDRAGVVLPAQNVRDRSLWHRALDGLAPGGGTNIFAGLKLGYEQAAKHADGPAISRVILLSDGMVTVGVTDQNEFRQLAREQAGDRDITCTTIGVGLAFSEDLMLGLAEEGKGNYHFIKDAQETGRIFARELGDLTHVVARALRLRIHLADGVKLVKIFGSQSLDAQETARAKQEEKEADRKVRENLGIAEDRRQSTDEPGIKMLIPHFYHGDSHVVLLQVRVPPGHGARRVADVHLKYKDVVFLKNRLERKDVSVSYTNDREAMIASTRRDVAKNRVGFEIGETLIQSARLVEQGQVGSAVKELDERMVVLGVAARAWTDLDLERDGKLLAQYKKVVARLDDGAGQSPELGQYLRKSLTYSAHRLLR